MKYALLIHLLDWKYEKPEFIIDSDISFVSVDQHPVGILYDSLCKDTGLDDSSPYTFKTALILNQKEDDYSLFPSSSPGSLSSTFLNLLTIIHGGRFGHCRVIGSKDNFITSWGVFELYDSLTENIFHELENERSRLDQKNLQLLQNICINLKAKETTKIKHSRINNALDYFYLAWNVHTLEQTAIGLSIVMETLFSPHSNTELSHQVSFNIAKFAAKTKKGKHEKYRMIKKYYSIRSKIVHGEPISNDEYESIPTLFRFVSALLLKILNDKSLIILFNDNKLRKQYLDDLLFD